MRRRGNPVTTVNGSRQTSLFAREQLAPFVKRRWKWIVDRIREEDRQEARCASQGGAERAAAAEGDLGAGPPETGVETPHTRRSNNGTDHS